MSVKAIRRYLIQKKIPSRFYQRRLIVTALLLLSVIGALAIIQWAVGTRGWDFSAGLLTIVIVTVGFGLAGVLVKILRGRPLTAEELEQQRKHVEETSSLPWNQPSWYDPTDPASPYYDRRD